MNIVGNLLTEFNQEDYDRNRRAEGFEDGVEYGERQATISNAKNLLKLNKLSAEEIADCCSLPLEQVLALKEELNREPATAK